MLRPRGACAWRAWRPRGPPRPGQPPRSRTVSRRIARRSKTASASPHRGASRSIPWPSRSPSSRPSRLLLHATAGPRPAAPAAKETDAPEKDANPLAGDLTHTAIYDISAQKVYLPSGERLEAHSGLGDFMDDPRYVHKRNRGATPANTYE